jgi:hypothetical protein
MSLAVICLFDNGDWVAKSEPERIAFKDWRICISTQCPARSSMRASANALIDDR